MEYKYFQFTQNELYLPYRKESWTAAEQDGQPALSLNSLPACTVSEGPAGAPQGVLKNKVTLGGMNFDMFGYLETERNLGFREYVLTGGLSGLPEGAAVKLLVAIPLDKTADCVAAAGTLIGNRKTGKP